MLSTDPSNKCSFYNKYFFDDLYSYSYNESLDSIEYFDNGASIGSSKVDQNKSLSFIDSVYQKNKDSVKNVWIPIFITPAQSSIDNKTLFKGSSAITTNIGIEKAIAFDPKLVNWNLINGNMQLDWIITPQLAPFVPTYGLMCWYRNNTPEINTINLTGTTAPYNTVLVPSAEYFDGNTRISPSNKVIRKTEDLYLVIDTDHIRYSENTINHSSKNYFSVSKYIKYNRLDKENIQFRIFYKNNLVTQIYNNTYPSIWIPEGEMYSYIDSEEVAREEYRLKIASKSYLSPVLYSIYREIYHILTSRLKKKIVDRIPQPSMNINQSRMIKKISYVLATMPGMDRVTVSILNDIITETEKTRKNVNNELFVTLLGSADEDIRATEIASIEDEISKLTQIITRISQVFGSILNKDREYDSFNNNGLINTKKDLFNRLAFKYGGKIVLNNQAKIIYKHKLKYGPHIKINQDVMSKCSINLKDDVVFNNVKFEIGKFKAESKINLTNSLFELSHKDVRGNKVTIPLWDIKKKDLLNTRIPFSAGKDLEVNFYDPNIKFTETVIEGGEEFGVARKVSREIEFELSDSYIEIGDRLDPSILGGESPDIEWTKISGPDCLRFSNNFISNNAESGKLRYPTSNDINPTIYAKRPGRYVLKLTVSSNFGIISDTVVVHIIDPKTYSRTEPLLPATEKYLTADDNLCIILPSIRECSFGKQGVFWPSYSDCSVREPVAKEIQENINNLPQPGGSIPPRIISFGQAHHKFAIPMPVNQTNEKIIEETDSQLIISYDCNNTIVELTKIVLTNMMDNNDQCSQCESLYDGIPDNAGFMIDAGYNFSFFNMKDESLMDVPAPNSLSTKRADIKSYGGFTEDEVKHLGIILPDHPKPGTKLKSFELTEDLLSYKPPKTQNVSYICHDTHVPINSSIQFSKGYFHPFSGWIDTNAYQDLKNKTSVINFRSEKSPQKFRGLGFYDLENTFTDSKTVIYKSTITLDVDKAYQVNTDKIKLPKGITIDLPDQITHYGYRAGSNSVSLKTLSYVDNCDASFTLEQDDAVTSDEYCGNGVQEYSYSCGYTATQAAAVGGSIYDLEIKLNYLNYINPKDLVIWLEVNPCADVADSLNPPQKEEGGASRPVKELWEGYRALYKELGLIDDNNIELKQYLYNLWDMNDNDYIDLSKVDLTRPFGKNNEVQKRTPKFYLYLTNQDHIYGMDSNKSILFTDKLDLYNNVNNNNSFTSFRNKNNHISVSENNTIYLPPTVSARNFSDVEINKYKNVTLINRLYNHSHHFFKFNDKDLYEPAPGGEGQQVPPHSSSTSFTLCIAITNESDSVEPYDRLKITDAILGFDSSKVKNKSNLIKNSLCSWDLILHKGENLGTYGRDSLGSIDYYSDTPQYSGYNFIANLDQKLHLIPPINLNAPNFYTTDGRACQYSKESLNIPTFLPPQSLNLTPFVLLMPFTLIGALVTLELFNAHMNNEARQITNYFGANRRSQQKELFDRAWFVPKYTRYPDGSPNKALINVSRDGGNIWYKLEASIFRYDNSLVMQKKAYQFIKLHYKSILKSLSIFEPQIPENYNSFIENLYNNYIKKIFIPININITSFDQLDINTLKEELKTIKKDKEELLQKIDTSDENAKKDLQRELNQIINEENNLEKTITSSGLGIENGDLINLTNQENESDNGYYIYQKTYDQNNQVQIKITRALSHRDLFISNKLSQYNNIYDLSMTIEEGSNNVGINISDGIANNQILMLDGVRPYHFFTATEHKKIVTFKLKSEKELTKEDKKKISDLEASLEKEQQKKPLSVDNILDIENQLWDIKYHKYDNEIIGQGYIYNFKESTYKTVLILKTKMEGNLISIDPSVSQRAVFYKNDMQSIVDDNELPFSLWSNLQNTQMEIKTPIQHHSSWAAGNYGFGSNLTKNIHITDQVIDSKVLPFSDTIDIDKNSKNRIGSFKIINNSNQIINGIVNSLGFKYNLYDVIKNEPQVYNNKNTLINLIFPTENITNIFNDLKMNVFTKQIDLYDFIELNLLPDDPSASIQYGDIYFNKDIKQNITYGLENSTVQVLDNRIAVINTEMKNLLKKIQDESNTSNPSENIEDKKNRLLTYNNKIIDYQEEKRSILIYKEKVEKTITKIPHISVKVKTLDNGSLAFIENHKNNYYWIDIDANQSCSIDKDRIPKILKEVRIVCIRFNDQITSLAEEICVMPSTYGGAESLPNGADESFDQRTGDTRYILSKKNIDAQKAKYPTLKWPENDTPNEIIERQFFLNFAGIEKAQLVKATYSYILPIIETKIEKPSKTTVQDRVYNIFNLDDINNILVDFKRIPRAIKGKDTIYDIYEPNDLGQLTKSIIPAPGGPIDCTFRAWRCIDVLTGKYITTPLYYQWLNEMLFRGFYGSKDGIEHKGKINAESKDETYWIPYDYN